MADMDSEDPLAASRLRAAASSIRTSTVPNANARRTGQTRVEKVLFNKTELLIPEALIEDVSVFLEIVTPSLWKHAFTEAQRAQLMKLLPTFEENDLQEKQTTLRLMFGGKNFKFGTPLRSFHKKLRDGNFHPDIVKYAALCRKAKLKEYHYQQQTYYASLLKEVLVNRQRILEQVYLTPPDKPLRFNQFQWRPNLSQDKSLEYRVDVQVSQVLREVSEECGVSALSDEDDGILSDSPLFGDEAESPEISSIQSTMDVVPFLSTPKKLPAGYKRRSPQEFTEQDFKHMISRHKKRKREYPDHPEMNPKNVALEDILTRCHVGKKAFKTLMLSANQKKRTRSVDSKKVAAPMTPAEPLGKASTPTAPVATKFTVMASPDEDVSNSPVDLETLPPPPPPPPPTIKTEVIPDQPGIYNSFFSMLRSVICAEPDMKLSASKLEDKVTKWRDSAESKNNSWITDLPDWLAILPSALKFLSGDILTFKLDNFIPLLDYKERVQMWRWIAQDRDSDAQLKVLYDLWRSNPSTQGEGAKGERSNSPPPPNYRTDYIVRPSTLEEKNAYNKQEEQYFVNPHRPFTFNLHGYKAVVGPVKGVFEKEANTSTKAREHALLINERPAFVTILTLVRNAAARLPNGEGSRSDVCELLKDSQYLAPGVTDTQINTVVSGALDRLHYEKDPCVKYDVNRKLWIYLHRNRSEEDFEKIHEVDRAAAKAKKALSKSKPNKKSKEAATPNPSLTRQSSVLSTCSNDSFINVETLSPPATVGPIPRPASPRASLPTAPPTARVIKAHAKVTPPVANAPKSLLQTMPPKMTTVVRPTIQQQPAAAMTTTPSHLQQLQQQRLLNAQKTALSTGRGTTVRQQLMAVTAKAQSEAAAAAAVDASTPVVHMTTKSNEKPAAVSAPQLRAQFISSSGKPVTFSASPIIIGGKQAIIGGKPLQLGGMQNLQIISNPRGQFLQGLPAGVTAINVVSQASQGISSISSSSTTTSDAKTSGLHILQAGSRGEAMKLATGQTVRMPGAASGAGTRLLTHKPGGGLMVTQLPGRSSAAGSLQAKTLTMSQANLLAAGQPILVQQSAQGGQPKVVNSQQLIQGTGLRPAVLSAVTAAQKSPNIQLVKTMLSQQEKTGQATILLTQPLSSGGQSGGSNVQLSQAKMPVSTTPAAVVSKSKAGPVYARIITPPPGIRLAAVRPGQVTQVMTPVHVSQMPQGVSMIQALSRLPAPEASQDNPTSSSSDSEQKAA